MRTPRRRPPWWPADEPWPPERWPPQHRGSGSGDGGDDGPWGPGGWGPGGWGPGGWGPGGWRRGGPAGRAFLVGMAIRGAGFLAVSVALVLLLGYVGAAILGVATAPVGAVLVGMAGIVALVAVLAAAGRAFRRAGRPLERLVDAAGRVERGDYSARVPDEGPPDLRALGRAFNQMTERLEAGDRSRRTFLADVSHELRTPLTVMRGQLEAIADGVYPADAAHLAPVLDGAAALERLVDDLRTVALAEAGALPFHPEAVDLGALARSVAAGLADAARAAGVTLEVDGAELPPLPADPALLRRVLVNLLTNALRHTPAGGAVRVTLGAGEQATHRLAVTDTGPGIPAELLPRVFDRFARGVGSPGTGLGLAIARDLVLAHGGTISVEEPASGGTRMVVDLPSIPTAAARGH